MVLEKTYPENAESLSDANQQHRNETMNPTVTKLR